MTTIFMRSSVSANLLGYELMKREEEERRAREAEEAKAAAAQIVQTDDDDAPDITDSAGEGK